MIAKIITGKDINGVIAYNINKVENGKATVLSAPNCITKSIRSDDFSNMKKSDFSESFRPYLDANLRTEKPVMHVILSLKENDIPDDKLKLIACRYMEGMGYGNQPFIVIKHEDVDNVHLHIVTVKVDLSGRKLNDRYEKIRSNNIRKALEKEYGLYQAEQDKLSKKERYQKDVKLANAYIDKITFKPDSVAYGEKDLKDRIATVLRYVKDMHNIDGMNAYNRVLNMFNVACYEVKGKNNKGEEYIGVEYCVINNKGAQISRGISGSTFGKNYAKKGLDERFKNETVTMKHDKLIKDARKAIKYVVTNILRQYPSGISESMLNAELSKHAMQAQFFRNEEGRLYGVSFNDNIRKVNVKGSEIKFSAAVLQNLIVEDKLSISAKDEALIMRNIKHIYNEHRKKDFYYESEMVNNLLDLRDGLLKELSDRVGDNGYNSLVMDKFIRIKFSELADIIAKETAYFNTQSKTAVEYSKRIDAKLRTDYLYGMGIGVDGDKLFSVRNRRLSIGHDLILGGLTSKARLFSKQERDLLKVIAEGDLDSITFDVSAYLSIFKYLTADDLLKVKRKMTADAVNRVLNASNEQDIKGRVELLLERGYVIHAIKRDNRYEYYVGDVYEKENTFVRLSGELSRQLDVIEYSKLYDNIRSAVLTRNGYGTFKYKLIVDIIRAIESENKRNLEKRIAELEKRNIELAMKLSGLMRKNDLKSMIDTVKNYPNDSLSNKRKIKI